METIHINLNIAIMMLLIRNGRNFVILKFMVANAGLLKLTSCDADK